jgi:nucleotide-binding universal stress UspA family protein
MYRCIVAPVDGSAFGEHALPVATAVARRSGASLRVVHVHIPLIAPAGAETVALGSPWTELSKQEERAYLDALVRRIAEAHRVPADYALVEGVVPHALERHARHCGAGLVVMSTHGYTRFRRLWHSGVAEHVARELPVPVLLVRPAQEELEPDLAAAPELRHLLVPLDGTPYAESIVRHAVALGRPFRARYTLLRVVRPERRGRLAGQRRMDRERTRARQYLSAIAERLRAAGLEVRTHVVLSDDPAQAILDVAQRATSLLGAPVDLIALEAHPHRPAARILAAHTADRVVRDAPVPVLLFDPPPAPVLRAPWVAPSARA